MFSNTAANLITFRLVWSIQHLQTTKKKKKGSLYD